jgi:hypothetical protein
MLLNSTLLNNVTLTDPKLHNLSILLPSPHLLSQTLKRVLHSLSCGKYKVLKRIAAGAEGAAVGEKDKSTGGLIKTTDSFVFNAAFRYVRYFTDGIHCYVTPFK